MELHNNKAGNSIPLAGAESEKAPQTLGEAIDQMVADFENHSLPSAKRVEAVTNPCLTSGESALKKNYDLCVDLKTLLQEDSWLMTGKKYPGVLTRVDCSLVCFVEKLRMGFKKRNKRFYNGAHITLTIRSTDGYPRLNFKPLRFTPDFDKRVFVFELIEDVLKALSCLEK